MSTESVGATQKVENLEVRWFRFLQRAANLLAGLSVVLAGAGLARRQAALAERDAARHDCVCCPGATAARAQDEALSTGADAGGQDAGDAAQPADEEDVDR